MHYKYIQCSSQCKLAVRYSSDTICVLNKNAFSIIVHMTSNLAVDIVAGDIIVIGKI